MSTLKALQLRVNWLNSRDNLVQIDPRIYEYARKTMGKGVSHSPDAWVALRQTYDPYLSAIPPAPVYNQPSWVHRVSLPFRNWEKWLYQREVSPNGRTIPVYQLAANGFFDTYNFKAFEALRTDHASGSDYIYFAVDDKFAYNKSSEIQIKITFLDNVSASWWVEYDAGDEGIYKKSAPIVNKNDDKWKTVTLELPNACFANRQTGNMDFRIYNGGVHNITVRFVRIIKKNEPSA